MLYLLLKVIIEASRGAVAQNVAVKSTGCGFEVRVGTRGNDIFIYIYIFISLLWCRAKHGVEFTQHAMPPELDEKWDGVS